MPLYRIVDSKFFPKQRPIQKEKDLQRLVEPNLLELLDVHFLETEYNTTSGGRIDTLGVDRNGAPVIIEYKRNQNDNVINQALSYRKWLTAQKREFFEMLINKRLSADVAHSVELDWKHPRIICIAETFNRFDIDTADVLLPVFRVELMTYRVYENDIFHLEPLQIVSERQAGSPLNSDQTTSQEIGEVQHSVESHRSRGSAEIQAVFDDLRARILALGPQVVERVVQPYIGYRASKNFAEVHIQKSTLRIALRGIYNDPQGKAVKVPDSHEWTLNWQVTFSSPVDLDYVMSLVEQSYNDVS
jgi:predicted transport protein